MMRLAMTRMLVAMIACLSSLLFLGPAFATDLRGVRCTGRKCVVPRATAEEILDDVTALGDDVRVVPSLRDGVTQGYELRSISPRSIFAKLGLRNGDVVRSVNGSEVSNPFAALALYTRLRGASRLIVVLERRRKPVTLDITIR